MSMLVWIMVGIAIWHFAVFVPDRFYGGIVGAFLASTLGAALFGFVVAGLSIPGDTQPGIAQGLIAVPGAVLGLAISYAVGVRYDPVATDER